MESSSSVRDSSFLTMDNDYQLLIMLKNAISSAFSTSVFLTITAIQYFFFPVVLMYSFWAYAIEKSWQITKYISSEIYNLMQILPLSVKVWYLGMLCVVQFLFLFKKMEEISIVVEKQIYVNLKVICTILNLIPLSHKHAAGLYTIMKRVPIFGKGRLPFPNFLFEDTFTSISFRKDTISMTIAPPEDFPQTGSVPETTATGSISGADGDGEIASTSTTVQSPASGSTTTGTTDQPSPASGSTTTGTTDQPAPASTPIPTAPVINEPKPATSSTNKKPSPGKSKSDEKLAKPTDVSTDQSPSTSTSDVKASSSI
ncbi:uncharacterized protein LOC135842309 [Planococcus citri]|uniref:uncharacterized protein LOC135842309 n=1 Tax=Planococcus citri TaxID=170843 RepID=UPI0031F768F2